MTMTTKKAPKKTTSKRSSRKAEEATAQAAPESPVGKVSALDAAAQVLGEAAEPLTTKQLIETMAAKGLWASPGGKTPAATLYSAILREIGTKGEAARFKKAERGKFTLA
jgi:hypothetical protein